MVGVVVGLPVRLGLQPIKARGRPAPGDSTRGPLVDEALTLRELRRARALGLTVEDSSTLIVQSLDTLRLRRSPIRMVT